MCKERFLTIVLRSGMDCISQEILGLCPSNAQVEILEDYWNPPCTCGGRRHLVQFMVFYMTEISISELEKSWEQGIA